MVNIVLELVAVMQRQKDAPPAMHPPTALRTHHSSLSARESPRQSSRVNDRNGRKTPVVVRSSASAPVQHNLSSRKRGHTPSERRSLPYTFSFDHEDNTREVAVILDAPLAKRARLDVVDNNYDPSSAIAHTSSTLQAGASPLSHDDSPPRIRNTEDAISQSKVSRHSSALPKSRSGSVHDTTELGPNDHGSATNDAGTDVIGKSSTEPTRKNGLVTRHQEPSSIPTNESGETGVNTAHRRKSYTPARVAGEEDGIQNKAEEQTSKVTASQQPAHAGRTVASTKPRNFALAPINFSISDKANPKTLKETRDKFYQSLRETTVVVKYRNQNTTRTFSDKEAADLSNFFFDEMLGPAALKRLRGLIREYNVPTEEGIGPQQLARAEQASMDKDVLPVFRDFFEAFRQEQRNRVFIGSSVYTVHSFISSLTAGKSLEELLARADKRDPQIVQEMEARGYKTSAGVGFKTVVRNYLCDTLDIDHDTLAKSTEPSKVLTSMVSTFGLGILTILPFSFITRYAYVS